MRARAPGKVVLSGAYAVLEGATALVAAVDRYVVADSGRAADLVTPEVSAALAGRRAPWFDASELRDGGRKLGLGSSAAIVVASLAALELDGDPELAPDELARRVFAPALAAHAAAQGGGSGVDVAASAYGGVLAASRASGALSVRPVALPRGVVIHVLSLGRAASTSELITRVKGLAALDATTYARCMDAQSLASERAAAAVARDDAGAFVEALREQARALSALGAAAGAPIVTPELAALRAEAERAGDAVIPSGAGGGDIALWVSSNPDRALPTGLSLPRVALRLGAPGVQRWT